MSQYHCMTCANSYRGGACDAMGVTCVVTPDDLHMTGYQPATVAGAQAQAEAEAIAAAQRRLGTEGAEVAR